MQDGLIKLIYGGSTPLRMQVSPELALLQETGRPTETDRLLAERSRQVYDLLKENIALRVARATNRSA